MENKKSSVLRKQKLSIKSKLMAAVAMLVVATMLLSTTTYAWFVLSTAPEVQGMTTTVGSNGNLEIALLDDTTGADMTTITSGVGTSYYVDGGSWLTTNVTWGNLLTLSDVSYGLGSADLKLYPAVLKAATNATAPTLSSHDDVFSFAQYGLDGRVTSLGGTTYSGKYDTTNGFLVSDVRQYGVRAIGTVAQGVDANTFTFNRAKNSFINANLNGAAGSAISSSTMGGLLSIIVKHAQTTTGQTETYNDVSALTNAKAELLALANQMENAVKNGIIAESYTGSNAHLAMGDLTDEYLGHYATETNGTLTWTAGTYSGALLTMWQSVNQYKTKVANLEVPTVPAGGSLTWDDINDTLTAIMNTSGNNITLEIYVGDATEPSIKTMDEIRAMSTDDKTAFGLNLMNQNNHTVVATRSGLLVDAANIVGAFQTPVRNVAFVFSGTEATANVAFRAIQSAAEPTITAANTAVEAFVYSSQGGSSGSTLNAIDTFYGYAIDFAFRTNAAGNLLLSAAQNRVSGQNATAGAGSVFTFADGASEAAAAALRFAFVDDDANNTVLAIAKLGTKANGAYPLVLYQAAMGTGLLAGTITTGELVGADTSTDLTDDNVIVALDANIPKRITVIVYLDGNDVQDSMEGATGTLNLQFASSATLTPMDYDFGGNTQQDLTSVLTATPTSFAIGATSTLSLTVNGQAYTGEVTYLSSNTDVATVDGATITGVAAGTATITATVAGEAVATVEITVTE